MLQLSVSQVEHNFAEVMQQAARGEPVILTQDNGSQWQLLLVPVDETSQAKRTTIPSPPTPVASKPMTPTFGSAKGLVQLAEEF